jgi:ABC-type uncharacterized transport system substrate-binding protein
MVLKTSPENPGCPARRRSFFTAFLYGIAAASWPSVVMAEGAMIAIVLTPHDTYRASASALEKALSEKGHKVQTFELPRDASKLVQTRPVGAPAGELTDPDVIQVLTRVGEVKPVAILAVGETATVLAAEGTRKIPIIYCTVTNALDMPVNTKGDPRAAFAAGVTTDVSPKEQIQWVRKVQPRAGSLGVLCSEHSSKTAEAIRVAGEAAGLNVVVLKTTKEDFVKAVEAVSDKKCDGILMLADARIYDGTTAKHLLLWGVRNRKSVWAFSENFVRAGALSGSYADSESMVRQTTELVDKIVSGGNPATIGLQYPTQVRHAINERTGTLIGLNITQEALQAAGAKFGSE